jgi:hypothetical protein
MSSQTQQAQQSGPSIDGMKSHHQEHQQREQLELRCTDAFPESSLCSFACNSDHSEASGFPYPNFPRNSRLTTVIDGNGCNNASTASTNNNNTMNGKVMVGSSDYLVLNMKSRHDNNCNKDYDTNPNHYYFETDTAGNSSTNSATVIAATTTVVSRLTKKLSKHKKLSHEFPADEITVGASTIDLSVTDQIFQVNDDSIDNSILHTSTTTSSTRQNVYSENGNVPSNEFVIEQKKTFDEIKPKDESDHNIEENIQLLDVSVNRESVTSSDSSENHLIDSNHAVVISISNHLVNTTCNRSVLTNGSHCILAPPTQQSQRPTLPTGASDFGNNALSRYNHYDWSYTEESTITASMPPSAVQQRKQSLVTCNRSNNYVITMNGCDVSTLATATISNTSMDTTNTFTTTPDTSFDTTISTGPVVVTPTLPEMTTVSKAKKKVTIIDSEPRGKGRFLATTPALRSPLEHDTLVIVEDGAKALKFRHTSLILQYASVELANYVVEYDYENSDDESDQDTGHATLKENNNTIQYILHVSAQDANDWRSLQPFLEPHAVQPAVVTPNNLPVLLPWFKQLKLNVLLQECDMQLLHHLATPPPSPTTLDQFQRRSVCDEDGDSDDYLTLWNALRLGEIAVKAGLERTAKQAFIVAATWLKQFPSVWLQQQVQHYQSTTLLVMALNLLVQCSLEFNTNESDEESQDLDISFESSDSTTGNWESMFQPPEASCLFAAMITYLPNDCVDQQRIYNRKNVRQLLMNPLCPFLIREGIRKKEDQIIKEFQIYHENDDDNDRHMLSELHLIPAAFSDENVEMIADNETVITENLSPTLLERRRQRQRQQQLNSNRSTETRANSASSSLLQVAEELHAGWNSIWMKLAVVAAPTDANVETQTQERENSNCSIYQALSHTQSDQQFEMLSLQSPKELSEWLHVVWGKLCHPPTFGARHGNSSKKQKDTKKRGLDKPPQIDEIVMTNDDTTNMSWRRTFAC